MEAKEAIEWGSSAKGKPRCALLEYGLPFAEGV
jgi:hypothetical protein